MLDKIIELEERFPQTGEPTLMVVGWHGRAGWTTEKTALASSASPALDYIRTVQPKAGSTIILVNALGAFETYDDNRNGDGFPELTYNVGKTATCGHAGCQTKLGWIAPEETLVRHYDTFEKFGNIYEHHVNKDPTRSLGTIVKAFWNARMHRVELLLELVDARKPELIQQIGDGVFPAVSMGCHVKWDVCSVCGHRAPTRRDYCNHLKFEMRKIDPRTGIRFCALNPSPRFFDISIVIRPADPTGYMLKKVAEESRRWWPGAELGAKVADHNSKQATVRKLGDIQKDVVGDVMATRLNPESALVRNYRKVSDKDAAPPEATDSEIAKMARFTVPQVVSTLASKHAYLSASELGRLVITKCGQAPSTLLMDKLAAIQPAVNELFALHPELIEKISSSVHIQEELVRDDLAQSLGPWLQKRAGLADWARKLIHDAGGPLGRGGVVGPGANYEAHAPALTDVYTMTDPNTGETYKTNRGAVHAADDTNNRALLGGTALLTGAYALGLSRLNRPKLSPVTKGLAGAALAAGTVYGGKKFFEPHDAEYMTDQGTVVPGNVEFRKTGSLEVTTYLLDKLAYDYRSRIGASFPGANLAGLLTAKIAFQAGTKDPLVCFLKDKRSITEKVSSLIAGSEKPSYDATAPERLEFDDAADAIGRLLVKPSLRLESHMSRIDEILNQLNDVPAAPTTKTASQASGLDAAIQNAIGNLERSKIASAQAPAASPVNDLMKIAEEIRAADEDAEVKIASRSGAAFVDSMMERLELYRAQAAEMDKQAGLEAEDVLSKFAAAFPEQYNALVQGGYFGEPTTKEGFDQEFRDETAAIHEKAAQHFVAGYAALEEALA